MVFRRDFLQEASDWLNNFRGGLPTAYRWQSRHPCVGPIFGGGRAVDLSGQFLKMFEPSVMRYHSGKFHPQHLRNKGLLTLHLKHTYFLPRTKHEHIISYIAHNIIPQFHAQQDITGTKPPAEKKKKKKQTKKLVRSCFSITQCQTKKKKKTEQ